MFGMFAKKAMQDVAYDDKRPVVWLEEKPNVWRIVYADDAKPGR